MFLSIFITTVARNISFCLFRLLARMTKMNKIVGCDWGERSMDSFDIIKELGDGTPSRVFKAIDRDSSKNSLNQTCDTLFIFIDLFASILYSFMITSCLLPDCLSPCLLPDCLSP